MKSQFCKVYAGEEIHPLDRIKCVVFLCLLFVLQPPCAFAQTLVRPMGQLVNAPWQPAWAKGDREPSRLVLRAQGPFMAQIGTYFTVSIGGVSTTNWGAGNCDGWTIPDPWDVPINPYQPIQLTVTGSNLRWVHLDLTAPGFLDLAVRKTVNGRPATPAQLKVFVDGVEQYTIDDLTNACSPYARTWTIEVRPDKDSRRRNSLGRSDDTTVPETQAPGDADWPELGPGQSTNAATATISWSVGLGRLSSGRTAGRLQYRQYGLSSNSYTPASLFLYEPLANNSQVQVITNSSIAAAGVPRQIKTPQAFLDIPTNTTNGFELRFYPLSEISASINTNTGCYDILTNSPFVVWQLSNPDQDPSVNRRLRISEQRSGITYTNEFAYDPTNQIWSLTRGLGAEQYRETRRLSIQTTNGATRFETNVITDGAGNVAYEGVETYYLFYWGWEMISLVTDPSGGALTTTYEYDSGSLIRIDYPDGSWETRTYDSTYVSGSMEVLTAVSKPFKDAAPPGPTYLATQYDYARVAGTGEIYPMNINRYEGTALLYRYDNTKRYVTAEGLEGETYQVAWLPTCDGARVREGAVHWPDSAAVEAAGQISLTLTNYLIGTTNFYESGTWSNLTFTAGAGTDWRKSCIHGQGSLYDNEAPSSDQLDVIPFKSTKECEIRQGGVLACREFYVYAGSTINGTNFDLVYRDFNTNDVLGHSTGQRRVDAASGIERTLRTADWRGTNQFPGQLLLSEADEDGLTTTYAYDSLKRVKSRTLAGTNGLPDYVVSYAYDACGNVLLALTNAGSLSLSNQFTFDRSRRLTRTIDHAGLTNAYQYFNGGRATCLTYAGGATLVRSNYVSGDLKSETGTSIVSKFYDSEYFGTEPSIDLEAQKKATAVRRTVYMGYLNSPRQTINDYNMWDSPVADLMADTDGGTFTNRYYYENADENVTRKETRSIEPTRPILQRQAYDSENHPNIYWLDLDRGGPTLFLNGDQRVTQTEALYTNISGAWFRATNVYAYLTDASDAATVVSQTRQRLNGFASGVKAQTTTIDVNSNSLIETVYVDRVARKVTRVVTNSASALPSTNIVVNGLLQSESTFTVAKPTLHTYDALRREIITTMPAGATTTATYDSAGRTATMTDFAGNTTTYAYYGNTHTNAGRLSSVTAANGKKTYFAYNFRGDLIRKWGDVPYPEERVYSDYGELIELHTFRGGSGWSGSTWPASPGTADVTTWSFDPRTGLLLSKTDAAGRSVYSFYYDNDQLYERQSSRASTFYHYNDLGDFTGTTYSDGTPSVLYTNFNRAGLPRLLVDGTGQHTLTYDYASRLISDACTSGDFSGITISNHFNPLYGRDFVQAQISGQSTIEDDYGYDAYGRMNSASYNGYSASYSYLANSDRLETTTCKSNSLAILTTTRAWQAGMRLQSIANVVGDTIVSGHNYLYDQVHRRTQATLEDSSIWKYAYNDRDELISGKRYWADWAPVSGQQFEYAYDNIGNRTSAKSGGDTGGSNLRTATYGANALNQYTNITTPGYKDIIGASMATNSVTVNGNATDRKVEYFHNEQTMANDSGPVYQSVSVTSGTSNVTGNVLFPPNQQAPTYDDDGNLISDGLWIYTWDSENRLVQMASATAVTSAAKRKLVFGYDAQGRRTRKQVYLWGATDWNTTPSLDQRFVYDGWNLLVELNATNNAPIRSYLWGLDLSCTLDGAGGVSGLIAVRDGGGAIHFAAFDGNGSLVALINASDLSLSAHYEYSPFGETLRATGAFAGGNPFGFSSRFTDRESNLLRYPKRDYNPVIAKWFCRDPAAEEGGNNLYAFVMNNPLNVCDSDGEGFFQDHPSLSKTLLAIIMGVKAILPGSQLPNVGREIERNRTRIEESASIGNSNRRRGSKGLGKGRGGKGAVVGALVLFAGVLTAEAAGQDASGSAADPEDGIEYNDLARNARDFVKHTREGDTAMADLDAALAAQNVSDLGGGTVGALWVLEILWDAE